MSKTISHYVARFDMPGYPKGYHVSDNLGMRFPDVFEPVYKEDPVIPPGILSFIDKNGSPSSIYKDIEKTNPEFYKRWILRHQDDSVLTISVKGTEWSVGESVSFEEFSYKITELRYSENLGWIIFLNDGLEGKGPWRISKLPTRTAICQLPDENGKMVDKYQGEKAHWVDQQDLEIGADEIYGKWDPICGFQFFATLAAAEKYVLDNQPFYPRGLVEAVIQARNSMDYNQLRVSEAIDNLEAFRETHLKDKV